MRGIWFASLLAVFSVAVVAEERKADTAVDQKPGERVFQNTCAGCHGPKGTSVISNIPRLSAQVPSFLVFQWSLFKAGVRHDTTGHARMRVEDREIQAIVSFLAAQPAGDPWPSNDPKRRQAGEKLYQAGDFNRKIIACAVCHGKDGAGVDSLTAPRVAHQSPDYLVAETRVFKSPDDFRTPVGNGMQLAVIPLTDEDIEAVSEYLASMGGRQDSATGK